MDKPIQPTHSGLPYKFLAVLLFVISVIHISSAQVPSDGVNVDVVVSQPGLWPKEVTLATVITDTFTRLFTRKRGTPKRS